MYAPFEGRRQEKTRDRLCGRIHTNSWIHSNGRIHLNGWQHTDRTEQEQKRKTVYDTSGKEQV